VGNRVDVFWEIADHVSTTRIVLEQHIVSSESALQISDWGIVGKEDMLKPHATS
jgi:hypothetical protein